MRALKIMVIAMGVLLVLGIVGLVVGIVYKMNHPRQPAIAVAPHTALSPNAIPHGVALPAGAKVLSMQSEGDRVAVRIGLAAGGEELMLLDWPTGRTLSVIDLK